MITLFLAAALALLLTGLGVRRLFSVVERWNEVDWGNRWLNRLDGLNRLFCYRWHRLECAPLSLPETGPALLVANHVSGLDPLLMVAASRRPLRFIIATEQYRRFGLNWLFRAIGCIPVDRSARPERAFRAAFRALQEGEVVALFPQGRIQLDSEPRRPLKPGVSRMAQLADCPVTPCRIEGVAGEGQIILSVIRRSHARIGTCGHIPCNRLDTEACLTAIEQCIRPVTAASPIAGEESVSS